MQQEVTIQHPEVVEHPNSQIDLDVDVVQETLLGPERPHGDNSFQHFTEPRKDGRARVGFHPPEVTSSIEVPDSEALVHVTNDGGGEQEEWKNDTIERV